MACESLHLFLWPMPRAPSDPATQPHLAQGGPHQAAVPPTPHQPLPSPLLPLPGARPEAMLPADSLVCKGVGLGAPRLILWVAAVLGEEEHGCVHPDALGHSDLGGAMGTAAAHGVQARRAGAALEGEDGGGGVHTVPQPPRVLAEPALHGAARGTCRGVEVRVTGMSRRGIWPVGRCPASSAGAGLLEFSSIASLTRYPDGHAAEAGCGPREQSMSLIPSTFWSRRKVHSLAEYRRHGPVHFVNADLLDTALTACKDEAARGVQGGRGIWEWNGMGDA